MSLRSGYQPTETLNLNNPPQGETKKFDTGAVRCKDADETRYDLISTIGLERLAKTYAEGALKYDDHNWRKGFPFSDLLNHLERHIQKYKESGGSVQGEEDHLAHAAWGLFSLMHFEKVRPDLNDLRGIKEDLKKKL